jgi:hypothetical protein
VLGEVTAHKLLPSFINPWVGFPGILWTGVVSICDIEDEFLGSLIEFESVGEGHLYKWNIRSSGYFTISSENDSFPGVRDTKEIL